MKKTFKNGLIIGGCVGLITGVVGICGISVATLNNESVEAKYTQMQKTQQFNVERCQEYRATIEEAQEVGVKYLDSIYNTCMNGLDKNIESTELDDETKEIINKRYEYEEKLKDINFDELKLYCESGRDIINFESLQFKCKQANRAFTYGDGMINELSEREATSDDVLTLYNMETICGACDIKDLSFNDRDLMDEFDTKFNFFK